MKYIDSEKLIAEIERRIEEHKTVLKEKDRTLTSKLLLRGSLNALKVTKDIISLLQQDETQVDKMLCSQVWWEEQGWIMIPPDATIEGIDSLLKQVRKKFQQKQPDLPGIEEPGIPGKDYIPVEWVDACEMYGKWKIVKQEQPEVDLEQELDAYYDSPLWDGEPVSWMTYTRIAHHFYKLGLSARKEDL